MSCGGGCRRGLDLAWLWCGQAAAALLQPLAWELPFATGAALKKKEKTYGQSLEGIESQIFKEHHQCSEMGPAIRG